MYELSIHIFRPNAINDHIFLSWVENNGGKPLSVTQSPKAMLAVRKPKEVIAFISPTCPYCKDAASRRRQPFEAEQGVRIGCAPFIHTI